MAGLERRHSRLFRNAMDATRRCLFLLEYELELFPDGGEALSPRDGTARGHLTSSCGVIGA